MAIDHHAFGQTTCKSKKHNVSCTVHALSRLMMLLVKREAAAGQEP